MSERACGYKHKCPKLEALRVKAENWDNLRSKLKPLDTLVVKGEPYIFVSVATYEYYKARDKTFRNERYAETDIRLSPKLQGGRE